MPNILNRATKAYRRSVSEAAFNLADWVVDPDLSAVAGHPSKHWVINGDDTISLMTPAERAAVDDAEAQASTDADRAQQKGRMDEERLLKALALYFAEQINILRALEALPALTAADVRDGIKAKVDLV